MSNSKEDLIKALESLKEAVKDCPEDLCPTILVIGKVPVNGGVRSISACVANEDTLILALFDFLHDHPEMVGILQKVIQNRDEFERRFGHIFD